MTRIRLVPLAIVAVLALFVLVGTASASLITQTFNMPLTPTEITGSAGTGTFNYFQSAGAPIGAVLTGVQLRISVTGKLEALTVTNSDPSNPETFQYLTFMNIYTSSTGTAPAADRTALKAALNLNGGVNGDIDLYDTGNVVYAASQSIVYAPPAVSTTDDSALINATSITPYDTTGTFTLGFTTLTYQSYVGGGGNGASEQTTDAQATVEVVYNFTVVPEPATLTLLALGGGLAALRRRFVRKR